MRRVSTRHMKTSALAVSAFLVISLVSSAAPRLVVSTPSLVPESEIDLVLDAPVIAISELGKTVENQWLEIQPALPGKLLWKAQNIAQFLPDQTLAIDTQYTFSIPKNRNYLDASVVPAGKITTLASEPFRIVAASAPNRWTADYTPSLSTWLLAFNDDVSPASAGAFISFVSASGQRVAAKLEYATASNSSNYPIQYRPWAARASGAAATVASTTAAPQNLLIASPVSPLPIGTGWTISALKGLPNLTNRAQLSEESNNAIGDVQPFEITKIESFVTADDPRQILLSFSKALTDTLPENFLTNCLEISPQPKNLSAKISGRQIIVLGDYSAADSYNVTVKPLFASKAAMTLQAARSATVEFKRLEPALTLPSDNQAQLAKGKRLYQIQTVNLSSLHIRVKKLAGSDFIRAFQGYRNYTGGGPNNTAIEPVAPLPYPLIIGETILEKDFVIENDIDRTKTLTLQWDELLPKDLGTTALFLDITGLPDSENSQQGRRNAQAIIQLTDIGLAWKLTPSEALIYAFSCDTGMPLPGVKLQFYGEDASILNTAVTDASGIATLARTETIRNLHASLGGDCYLTAFDTSINTVGLWHFPIRYSWNKSATSTRRAFLFTDRSLYRPGETVRLKGIIRTRAGNLIEAAKDSPARIVITDPADLEIHSSPVTISAAGSFDFSYTLPLDKTGTHAIKLEFTEELAAADELEEDWEAQESIKLGARFSLPLRVEDFRRNAFEVQQTIAPFTAGATSVSVGIKAAYYQGQPVAAGKVKHFSQITAQNPYPERFRDFLFGNHREEDWAYWYHYFGYQSEAEEGDSPSNVSQIQGELNLAADGTATVVSQIPKADFPTARELVVSAEVTDANHQTLTSTATTLVHPAAVYIGISRVDQWVKVGSVLPLQIVATDTEGQPFAGAVTATATLTREVNNTVKSRTDSGATTSRNDVTEETLSTTEIHLDPAVSAAKGITFNVSPTASGLHYLTIRGIDAEGRPFATVTHFQAYGTNEYPWLYEDGMRVKLVAEKKSYKPGETARVLVLSPIEGTALVTVEREKVLRSFLVELKADKPVVEIPLTDADAPNAFVSVLIVKGAKESARDHKEPQLRLGYCEVIVENLRDALAVKLETPATSYRPGADISLSGSVTLADGKPAAGAEVTLYAEDEGTLAVMGYETPRPMDYFYKPRMLDVETGTSFETFISEDPANQNFHNKGFFIGGGGDMSKLKDLLRKNFDPCATWEPALLTDADGKFSHRFKVPDTLTRYRLIALAHHQAAQFGHTESALIVKKELMLEPKAPRFANQGDNFNPQVLVQNASQFAGTWEINYSTGNGPETPCATAQGPVTETITLAAGASTTVVFPTRAETTGEAVLTWRATPISLSNGSLTPQLKTSLSDAVETRFKIEYPMPLLRQAALVSLNQPTVTSNLLSQLDTKLLSGQGDVELEFSRSPLVEAAGAVDYLLHYPYGCIEQTTSSLIPWLTVEDLSRVIPKFDAIPAEKVTAAIQAGADRLLSMQLADGSFSYWPGSSSSVTWASSYAGLGLMLAREKGANVPEAAIERLKTNLIESLRGIATEKSPTALEIHARTLFVLALADAPQTAFRNVMIDRMADLTPSARSLLAAAIATEKEESTVNLVLAKSVMNSKVPLNIKDDTWMPYSADPAYRLIAWMRIDPAGPEATKALDRMLRERNPYGHWQTTWVNGWSLLAMAQFAKTEKSSNALVNLTFESETGNEVIQLGEKQPTATRKFKLSPRLKLNLTSDHSAFVRLKLASKPPIMPLLPVSKNGLSVDRIYERVNSDGSATILNEPALGDLIRVTLRVTLPKDDTRYLVIEDLLPATFETVNSDFSSQRAASAPATSETDWYVSHSELRNDRALFFLDEVWRRGTYTLSYLARCTVAGTATAPPAKVESMYDPENVALSASRVFTTK
jgi:alpha-2-macroglobulin